MGRQHFGKEHFGKILLHIADHYEVPVCKDEEKGSKRTRKQSMLTSWCAQEREKLHFPQKKRHELQQNFDKDSKERATPGKKIILFANILSANTTDWRLLYSDLTANPAAEIYLNYLQSTAKLNYFQTPKKT